jgi:superfamily I DNA/RNA helicase
MFPNQDQQRFLEATENSILLTARPGRGKTSVAMLKAAQTIEAEQLGPTQDVLFLTFSRNAVKQLEMASTTVASLKVNKNRIEISTYHSLMWKLLNSFGRYAGLPKHLQLLTQTQLKQVMIEHQRTQQDARTIGLTMFSGIRYDDFAPLALSVLRSSRKIQSLLSHKFPLIIVDEFQDTNPDQWEFIKLISSASRLICLADPDQMIFGFQHASNDRLPEFKAERGAVEYSLPGPSERSRSNVVLTWGEDILDTTITHSNMSAYKSRLKDYQFSNKRGPSAKYIVADFYKRHRRTVSTDHSPTIAVVAQTNQEVRAIREQLGKPTPSATMTFTGTLLGDSEHLDLAEELLFGCIKWANSQSETDLSAILQCFGSLLADGNDNPVVQSLLKPQDLILNPAAAKHSAKKILTPLRALNVVDCNASPVLIRRAAETVSTIAASVAGVSKHLNDEVLFGATQRLLELSVASGGDLSSRINEMDTARRKRHVAERIEDFYSEKRLVFATMHKLKGREFDYVCIVLPTRENREYVDLDERRLIYVALTRARYDAKILYSSSYVPEYIRPFI